VAVKIVHVSDLSGRPAAENDFAKLIVHEHPNYQTPITLEVLPDEIGELPDDTPYVRIELIQPGDRSGQRVIVALDQFNKLAASSDMNAILLRALATSHQQLGQDTLRRRGPGQASRRDRVNYATPEHAGRPHRGRITDAEKALVRDNLDTINARLRAEGQREIDPNDDTLKGRYGL
jgi:hypothetical protein